VIASTIGSAPAEARLVNPMTIATAAKLSANGSAAKPAAAPAQETATSAGSAPVRSASTPQPAGANVRMIDGSASTHAISTAPNPRAARYSGK
jgi:hypothetical protein